MMEREEIVSQILSRTGSGLDVFIHYIGDVCKKKNFKNPFREDSRASCRLYYNSSRGISRYFMQDFGDSRWCGDCFAIAGLVMGLDCHEQFIEILKAIDRDLNLSLFDDSGAYHPLSVRKPLLPHPSPESTNTVVQTFDSKERCFTESELSYWNRYGISKEILERYNVCSFEEFVIHKESGSYKSVGSYKEPMFGYKFGDEGIKIYRPMSVNRFFYSGILPKPYVFGMEQLPAFGTFLYVVGGEKDVMTMAAHGFNAICFNSETAKLPKAIITDLAKRFTYVFILYDCDETGKRESELRLKENAEIDNLYRIILPLDGTKADKDISDFFAKGGTYSQLVTLSLQAERTNRCLPKDKLRGFIKGIVKCYSYNIPKELLQMLNSNGITHDETKAILRCCVINVFGRDYHVLCLKNDSGSPVVYSSQLSDLPLTVGRSNVTTIRGKQSGPCMSCILFENYLDYLAFLSSDIMSITDRKSDVIIMGDYKSFPKLLIMCQTYDKIYTCFPNTEYGQIMSATVHHRSDGHGISLETYYANFPNIREYNTSKITSQ